MHPKAYRENDRNKRARPDQLEQSVYGDAPHSTIDVIPNDAGELELWIYGHKHAAFPGTERADRIEQRALAALEWLALSEVDARDRQREAVVEDLLGIQEVADLFGVDRGLVDNRRSRGAFPPADLERSGRPLWWRESLESVKSFTSRTSELRHR